MYRLWRHQPAFSPSQCRSSRDKSCGRCLSIYETRRASDHHRGFGYSLATQPSADWELGEPAFRMCRVLLPKTSHADIESENYAHHQQALISLNGQPTWHLRMSMLTSQPDLVAHLNMFNVTGQGDPGDDIMMGAGQLHREKRRSGWFRRGSSHRSAVWEETKYEDMSRC